MRFKNIMNFEIKVNNEFSYGKNRYAVCIGMTFLKFIYLAHK